MTSPLPAPGRRMPAEWEPHERTWMAFPTPNATFGEPGGPGLDRARAAWSAVANTVVKYEPVSMLVDPADREAARGLLDPGVRRV